MKSFEDKLDLVYKDLKIINNSWRTKNGNFGFAKYQEGKWMWLCYNNPIIGLQQSGFSTRTAAQKYVEAVYGVDLKNDFCRLGYSNMYKSSLGNFEITRRSAGWIVDKSNHDLIYKTGKEGFSTRFEAAEFVLKNHPEWFVF